MGRGGLSSSGLRTHLRAMWESRRRDPGQLLLVAALLAAFLLYAPTLGYGIVNHDDTWLLRDNVLLQNVSTATLSKVFFDTSSATRFLLGAEYLPVRDLSVMADNAVWGDWYGGAHLTSLVIYLLSLVVWFRALVALGLERSVAGLAILIWAVLPSHAESVAWLSERKGLLGVLFAGMTALGYAKFRAGGSRAWIAAAAICAVLAVWSKAPSAFAIAALAPIELMLGRERVSWRRSLVGLGIIAVAGALAFAPVVITAMNLSVVGTKDNAPAGLLAMPLGLHGFYLQLAVMGVRNAASYPVSTDGPSTVNLIVGVVALALALAAVVVPSRGRWRPSPAIRVGAVIWLCGFVPASRLGMPLRAVLVADRYILFATLGIALVAATGLLAMASARARNALIGVIVLAAGLRTLDARSNWRDSTTLWQRATVSNPHDGDAWSAYVEALLEGDQHELAFRTMRDALRVAPRTPNLVLRQALYVLEYGKRGQGVALMMEAAHGGESRAMANLALLLLQDGRGDEALDWARKATQSAPMYARGHRALGEVALAQNKPFEALLALQRTNALWPTDLITRYLLARTLIALHQPDAARPHLEACTSDPKVGESCRTELGQLRR